MAFVDLSQPVDSESTFVDLSKPAVPVKPEGLLNAAGRGLKESFQQVPELLYGVGAGIAAGHETVLGEGGIATAAKQAAIAGYTRWQDKIAAHAQENDSIDTAWDKAKEGDPGALVDWLAHGIGYVGGQALQVLATGGIGLVAGKVTAMGAAKAIASGMIEKEATRIAETSAGKALVASAGREKAEEVFAKEATSSVAGKIGSTAAIGVNAFGQEGGEIFGDLTQKNAERELTGGELGRAFGATIAAGGLEFVGDKLGLSAVFGKIPLGKTLTGATGIGGRVARGVAAGAAVAPAEAATEYGQTLLEEYGKGNEETFNPLEVSEATQKQAREAAALGALGGAAVGGAGGVLQGSPKIVAPARPILDAPDVDSAVDAFKFQVSGEKPELAELRRTYKDHAPEDTAAHQAELAKALENDIGYGADANGAPTLHGAPLRALAPQELPSSGEGLTRDAYEAIAALNQAQGKQTIVYQDHDKLPDGLVNQPDKVFISSKTSIDPVVVAAHEAQHLSEEGEPQAAYAKIVQEELTERAVALAQERHGAEMAPAQLHAEIRADITGDAWADPTFHGRVITKMREQLGEKAAEANATSFLESIKNLIERIKQTLTGTTFTSPDGQRLATQYVKNLERVHDALAAAIADQFIQKGYRPPGADTNTSQVLVARALAGDAVTTPAGAPPELVSALAAAAKHPVARTTEERLNIEAIRMGTQLSQKSRGSLTGEDFTGRDGNPQHITRKEHGEVSVAAIRDLVGQKGEVRGQHRNMQGPVWKAFKKDIQANGIKEPIFITKDWGKPAVVSEGNHRLDAAIELGLSHIPVEIRYFGNAQKQGLVGAADAQQSPKSEAAKIAAARAGALVNIGLNVGDKQSVTKMQATAALKLAGVKVLSSDIHQSDTEATLVARLDRAPTYTQETARALAIAQSKLLPDGQLTGDEWRANAQLQRLLGGATVALEGKQLYYKGEVAKLVTAGAQLSPKSPEFKKWFGDSKVVDANGEPLVVYHGTDKQFDAFRDVKAPAWKKWLGLDKKSGTFFFAARPEFANLYATGAYSTDTAGANLVPAYISMKNPIEMEPFKGESLQSAIDRAERDGHDGVIVRGWEEYKVKSDVFVALKPNQIKSVFNTKPDESAQFSPKPVANAKEEYDPNHGQDQRSAGPGVHAQEELQRTVGGGRPAEGWARATRVRGADGQPRPLYRGAATPLAPEHFKAGALGRASGNASSGLGVWFTISQSEAKSYGESESFFLDLRNPKVVRVEDLPGFDSVEAAHAWRESLRAGGHDGLIVSAKHLGGRVHVVAFDAAQVVRPAGAQLSPKTPEFKKWFAGSKVVDAKGEPKLMAHGTNADGLSEFRPFSHFGTIRAAEDRARTLREFSENVVKRDPGVFKTMPVYLRVENPLRMRDLAEIDSYGDPIVEGGKDRNGDEQYARGWESEEAIATTLLEMGKIDIDEFEEHRANEEALKLLQEKGYDGIAYRNAVEDAGQDSYIVFSPEQIKSADNERPTESPNISLSPKIVGDSKRPYMPEQRRFFERTGRTVEKPNLLQKIAEMRKDLGKKLAQGLVDQFAPLKALSPMAYMLARLSKGSAGALEALLHHGKLKLNAGAFDADRSGGFIQRVGIPLQGELEDFLWWVAANRAEMLTAQDRERLFAASDIAAGKSLANGQLKFEYTLSSGAKTRVRAQAYADSLKKFDAFNKNALDIAEQSGLIDPISRKTWEHEFYVPFYRVSEEDGGFIGANIGNALVRQRAFKHLKGGEQKLNSDLLANTIANWAHLIDASAKNRAAKASLEAAERMGVAVEAPQATIASMGASIGKNGVWFMDGGFKRHFLVDDPFVLTAITSLEFTGMKGPLMDAMSTMKHVLTVGVTASPFFKIKNLIRDSLQAIAVAPLNANPIANVVQGIAASEHSSQTYVSALASGGLIRFGTMLEGRMSDRVRQLVRSGVKETSILNSDSKLRALYDKFIDPAVAAYNELGNRSEEITRAALYKQLIEKGMDHAQASLLARDLMDFSLQGSWSGIRFLTQVVPFMNARMQGLYKLGRGAKENPARFAAVLGATALFSIALMAAYADDDDWKKREDWDRDNFWWFKIGGQAFRIPKPFEIGAIASLAERGLEYFTSPEMTDERFRKVTLALLANNLSMNPVPQLVKPLIDIYANKDSFTDRPIETMGMEKLSPDYRFNSRTSLLARAAGTAGQAVSSKLGLDFVSPLMIDHALRSYFGWLGSFVVGAADAAVRPLTSEPGRPGGDTWKLATGGLIEELPTNQSRYVSHMYDQARVIEQAYGTFRMLVKEGKTAEAREYLEENRDKLAKYQGVERIKRAEGQLNERTRIIERSNLDPETKKAMIAAIAAQKDRIARLVN